MLRYALHHFLGADESELTYKCLLLFMMQGINRVFSPGCKADYMLCIVGDQGAGKSTFFRFLALKDEWFSDDLRKIDDENVYRKMQGHWIIEMSEMITAINAKTVEEIKSFLTRTKENYKVPYEIHPADRQRQCIFGGTTNRKQFLPFDRTGNRRFLPIETDFVKAECHILDDEKTSREYFIQMWAEAMSVYKSGKYCLHFDKETEEELDAYRRNFMEEDTKVGMIQSWLDKTGEDYVCSTMIYKEALNHKFDAPKNWELKEVCEIMNHCISGWAEGPTHRFGGEYGTQRSWVRNNLQNSFNDLALPF